MTGFIIKYIVISALIFFVISFKPVTDVIDINGLYSEAVAAFSTAFLKALDLPCSQNGTIIQLPALALKVDFGCNGLETVLIYSVAVLAFPASRRLKAIGLICGFLLIQLLNIARIALLVLSGIYFREHFDVLHIYFAQGIMIALSLFMFIYYLEFVQRTDRKVQPNN